MSMLMLKLSSSTWFTPEQQAALESVQTPINYMSRAKDSPTNDYNTEYNSKFDLGLRQLATDTLVIIPASKLEMFLPCTVTAVLKVPNE